MTSQTLALVGGTGFIGRAVLQQLAAKGHAVRLLSRHAPAFSLPSNVTWHAADTALPETLQPHLTGCDAVVHLVAVLAERGMPFSQTITQSAAHTAQAAHAAAVPHFVYISALGASPQSPSRYARAKAAAEAEVQTYYPHAVLIRPSLVMGEGGGFRQQVEQLTRYLPVMVLPGWGHSRFQPIALEKLAGTIADHALTPSSRATYVTAAGAHIRTFRQLAQTELARLYRRRLLLPLPWALTWLIAYAFQLTDTLTRYRLLPAWLLVTPDQVRLLKLGNVTSKP